MRYTNDEILKMKGEFQSCNATRRNEIFETLSYIAEEAVQDVYNLCKAKYGDILDYEELLMDGYEKLFKLLDKQSIKFGYESDIYSLIKGLLLSRCQKNINKIQEKESLRLPIKDFQDEINWDNEEEGKQAWKIISKNCLNNHQLEILRLYFGFDGKESHSLSEIAEMYGTTRQNVFEVIAKLPKIYADSKRNLKYKNIFKYVKYSELSDREIKHKFNIYSNTLKCVVKLATKYPEYFEECE